MTTATLTTYKTKATTDSAAIHRYIKGLREMGWEAIRVYDGGEHIKCVGQNDAEVVAHVTAVEDATVTFRKGDAKGSIYFVLGNEPFEVAADMSLDDGEWDAALEAVEEAINLEGI